MMLYIIYSFCKLQGQVIWLLFEVGYNLSLWFYGG